MPIPAARRIDGGFAAMVRLPSTVGINIWSGNPTVDGQTTVPFEVLGTDGIASVRDGFVVLGSAADQAPPHWS